MTVCIAAQAKSRKDLILVSDSKVAFGDFSADDAILKNIPFFHPWALLVAGNDVSYARAIIERASARAIDTFAKRKGKPKETLPGEDLAEIMHEELVRERTRIIEASVLKQYGFTADSFRDTGKSLCSEALYSDLVYKIALKSLSLQFLLCGFDEGRGAIWLITLDSPPENFSDLGFWAIGTGANAALSSLTHSVEYHRFGRSNDTPLALYHVLAAKFMSESAQDVGKGTFVVILNHNGDVTFAVEPKIKEIREIWLRDGAPRVPPNIKEVAKASFYRPRKKRSKV